MSSRRHFLINSGLTLSGVFLFGSTLSAKTLGLSASAPKLKISLAQWSLHKKLFAEEMTNLDFAAKARSFDIGAIEYVSAFFQGNLKGKYLQQLNQRAADNDVRQLLIMIDGEGPLAASSDSDRITAVDNHKKWVEAASELGCHSIRVNLNGEGSMKEMQNYAADGLANLAEFAADHNINVIVENHGGPSSDAAWLAGTIKSVSMPNCGTLPDFGNFCIEKVEKDGEWECVKDYDRYKGMEELLPFAKAVSAKSYDFDEEGNETRIDYERMVDLVKASGYEGYIGVEYEGTRLDEEEGVRATKRLLDKYI